MADAVIVGSERSVAAQVGAIFDAGATDFKASPFPVGGDAVGSLARTHELLRELATS